MTQNGSLAHTGVSWPIYALVGLIAAGVGVVARIFKRG
ncbi:LPXTG cell wall anchor domain-containing protein [Streptomyces griseosporeus]